MVLDTIRKRFSLWIFKTKDERYHPREEERLYKERSVQRARDKERSRAGAAASRPPVAQKTSQQHPPLYAKRKMTPGPLDRENIPTFHRMSPVCRKLKHDGPTKLSPLPSKSPQQKKKLMSL